MSRMDIGPGGVNPTHLQMIPVSVDVRRGDTVTISNLAGSTLNVFHMTVGESGGDLHGKNQFPASPFTTIAASASQSFTVPVWIQSQGPRTSVRLTGGIYGNW